MKKIIRTLMEMIKTISKIFTLLLMFQIISFYSSAQTTYIRDGANNQKEIFDQNGNVMLSGNLIQKNITVDNPQSRGNSWEAIGPIGADIDEISICPDNSSILFAAAGNTYISNDGGANWAIIETLASITNSINCICALPEGKVIAGGDYFYGAYATSDDNGITWTKRDLPPNSSAGQMCTVKEIVYDPANPNIVFLGTTAAYGNTKSEVLYKSTDGGLTFEIASTEIIDPGTGISSICIDPTNSNVIFVVASSASVSSAVIVSTDGGESWDICSLGLPTQYPINSVVTYDGVTYIGGGHAYQSQFFGLYKSINTGQTWEDISSDFPSKVVNVVTISNDDPNIIYAGTGGDGVYRSNDGGQTWIYNTTGADNFSCYSLVINQDNSNEIFAGFLNMAVYRSLDAGASWELSANGICGMNLNDIAVNPVNSAQMLVAFEAQNCGGCYFTIDGGESWSLVESLPLTRYSAVAIDENGVLYAWSNGPSTVAQEGLYKSTDSGVSWTNMGPNIGPVFETEICDVEISSENPDIIIIAGNNYGNNGRKGVVHKSSNGGESWTAVFVTETDWDSFKHANINGNTAYLALHSQDASGGFYKSIDCGDNWIEINNGIPSDVKTANWITSDKTNPEIVFGLAGSNPTYFSVYKSIDGGSTWNDLNLHSIPWKAFTCLAIHPENNDMIYVGGNLASEPIYATVTGGDSWKLASNNFPTTNVTSFSDMVQIGDNYYLYASTISASAYGTEVQTPSFIQIEGFISDVTTSEPIPNAEIIFTGEMTDYSFISNDQGEFEHNEFVAGTYTIECNAEGYNSYYAENVEIFEPTTINIQLTTPIIGADVSVINAVVSPDGYNTSELTISNTGTGLLEWHSIINFEQEYGDIVFQLNDLSTQTPENTSIFGIEFDGENLWVVCTGDVSGYNHFLCKFDINGNLLATYDQNIDSWGLRGIYYHEDGYLYGGSNKGFHRIDPNDGSITNLFDWKFGLSCIRGLTYIPYLEGFVARDYSTDFVIFDVEGNLLGTLQKPTGLSSSVSDIDYDPIHDCIWLYNRSGSANTCFHQYSISQEALTDVVIDIPLFSGLNSQRSGGSFFSSTLVPGKYVLAGATNQNDPFDVLFAVDICPSWIKTNPNYGFVQPDESMDVVVEFDGYGLIEGETHNCTLHLSSSNPDVGQIDIPVTLQVEQGSTVTQIFDLETGYQFISSNVIPQLPDMTVVMADILNDNLDFVRNSQGSMLRKIGPNWVNGIGNWIMNEGYLVKMNADDSFEIEGFRIDPSTVIPVATGYQFVSYFPENSMDALLAFDSIIGDDLDFIRDTQGSMLRKIGPNWVNGIGDAMQGEGYLVKMFADGEIIYPGSSSFTCGDPFTDPRDGQTYNSVQIGDQCWMAENLNIGGMINGSEEMTDNGVIEKYCYDNDPANCDEYGGMYQWNEMMEYTTTPGVQGICPSGWHFPTDVEWTTLTDFLGGESVAGGKMKETGTTHWNSPNTGATNESGFTGLPGGYRLNGNFNNLGNNGSFWSSNENGANAWYRKLYSNYFDVARLNNNKNCGFSSRCLQDYSIFNNLTIQDKNRAYELSDPKRKSKEAVQFAFEGGNAADPVYTIYVDGLEIGDEVAAFDGEVMVGALRINSQNVFDNELPVFSSLISGHGYETGNTIILKVWSENNIVPADFTMELMYDSYVSDVYPDEDGKYSIVNITKGSLSEAEGIIRIYPNPATNMINISSTIPIKNVVIFNYVGQSVYEGNERQINTSIFDAGIYIIRVETANGFETQKLIIE